MINRKKKPDTFDIENVKFQKLDKIIFNNGIKLYKFNSEEEVVMLQFLFRAGFSHQTKPLQSVFTNSMLQEGSKNYNSNAIAEKLDFYGAHISLTIDDEFARVKLLTIKKFLPKALKILQDVILNPKFEKQELDKLTKKSKQHYLINNERVNFISAKLFSQNIFKESSHNNYYTAEDFDKIDRTDLIEFYNHLYSYKNCDIIAVGNLNEKDIDLIENYFGKDHWNDRNINLDYQTLFTHKITKEYKHKEKALQSGINIGKLLFDKEHEDFFKFSILNSVLGGYFGSRLMSNIREDKGYTYGIGSSIFSHRNISYVQISTQVGKEYEKNTLKEIYKEIDILKQKAIKEDELLLVKNYIKGQLLKSINGAMENASVFVNLLKHKLKFNYLEKYIDVINTVNTTELLEIAQKYFKDDYLEVVVGRNN